MQLPAEVKRIIEEAAEGVGFVAVKRAAMALSEGYREGRAAQAGGVERTAAYLVTRMPATYAAARTVLEEVASRLRGKAVTSVLDVGAGTGAASLAARACFPEAALTMLERDRWFAAAARQIVPEAAQVTMTLPGRLEAHDVVVACYSVGEMGAAVWRQLWECARVALVVIEPGTPAGFSLIRGVRDELLGAGARMVAPCPRETACPMEGGDWCHFAARVERSSIHRRVKGAALGYEDEKYSYLAVARDGVEAAGGRIIRRPRQEAGLIVLETCRPGGLATERVTRRDREAFRAARKASWGDAWGFPS